MITTEKDAVRIPPDFIPPIPFYYVRMEIEIVEGYEDFEEAVCTFCQLVPEEITDKKLIPFKQAI